MNYDQLPLLTKGRSKQVFRIDDRKCLIRLIPSLDSYTFDRHELVPGTDKLRLDFFELSTGELHRQGIKTAFVSRHDATSYIAEYLFVPPFETIAKCFAVGSTLRLYPGLFEEMYRFEPPIVKFDYRTDPADQPIGEDYLTTLGLPVTRLKEVAVRITDLLRQWLSPFELIDICYIFGFSSPDDLSEPVLVSEISPDCMRIQDSSGRSLDKDLFRYNSCHEEILEIWAGLIERQRQRTVGTWG